MQIHKYTDVHCRRLVDGAHDPWPAVLVHSSYMVERCTLQENVATPRCSAQTPKANRETNSVDTDAGEVSKVGCLNKSVPMSLEDGSGTILRPPAVRNVYFTALAAPSACEEGGCHPFLMHKPGTGNGFHLVFRVGLSRQTLTMTLDLPLAAADIDKQSP